MNFLFTLLTSMPLPAYPSLFGWVIWALMLAGLIYSLYRWNHYQPAWKGHSWGILIAGILLTVASNLFIGLRINSGAALPIPNVPSTLSPGSAMMLFSAVPWTLAAGILGPFGAVLLGAISGLIRGVWDTFNFFTTLEYAFLGLLYSVMIRQNYRTTFYKMVRQPIVGALVLIPLHSLLYIIGTFFSLSVNVPPESRLDFSISSAWVATLTFAGEIIVAGLVAEIIKFGFPSAWGNVQPLQPSPTEKSLETRFVVGTGTFITILLLTLLIGDWVVAGQAARTMLEKRLASTAQSAAQNIPFFLETGQNIALQLAADSRMETAEGAELTAVIAQRTQSISYFDEVFIVNAQNNTLLAAYPESASQNFLLYPQEINSISIMDQVPVQVYSLLPLSANEPARVSFIVAIIDQNNQTNRVLIGRTALATNPLTQPILKSLQSVSDLNGNGILLDENNRIIYHYTNNGQSPASYSDLERFSESSFFPYTASNGTRELVYYQPAFGQPWAVVLTIPAQQAQQLALNIATPLSVMIFILAIVALISMRLGLRVVTGSLQTLALEAKRITDGNLNHPLQAEGVDEVGQLRRAFEQMRVSLQSRLDELNKLVRVSQGVASSLEMKDSVQPILEAIQSVGANSVRVVLSPSIMPDTAIELPLHFVSGTAGDSYAYLDDQILHLAQRQGQIVIPHMTHSREFIFDAGQPHPLAMLAVALRHENRYYGVVWAGFEKPRNFSDSDIRFITTLAGQAALAVSNARLFLNVEAARRQLEAILNSTPDPVLVTDSHNRLLLANRAALEAMGLGSAPTSATASRPTEKIVKQKALLDLLQSSVLEKQSTEIVLADGRTYFATASSVVVEGKPIGRVCILRDVTHFKELDIMKSEFVSTVSHDLRSPLTLMRGYATMLDSSGELTDTQYGYIKKIITGVENMSRLVNDLLDLGRIDVGVGLQLENVPVLDIIERVVSALQLQASQKNIVLSVELPKDLPHAVEADQSLLHQAVYNLVENALKYTPENGRVTVNARNTGDTFIFIVEDNGIGISAEAIPHLFEKFYRSSQREARAQQGTGLGLAIVSSIAEKHGGKVWVESQLGVGSKFLLQIPLTQPKP